MICSSKGTIPSINHVFSKLKSSRLDLLQKDYIRLNFLNHSTNNTFATWDCHTSYIPRSKSFSLRRERCWECWIYCSILYYPKKKRACPEKGKQRLRRTHEVELTTLLGLSKQARDEAHFHLLDLTYQPSSSYIPYNWSLAPIEVAEIVLWLWDLSTDPQELDPELTIR
jgi:hypothetical protein